MKMQLHLLTYYRNLVEGIGNMSQDIEVFMEDGLEFSPENSPTKEAKNKVIYEGSCWHKWRNWEKKQAEQDEDWAK